MSTFCLAFSGDGSLTFEILSKWQWQGDFDPRSQAIRSRALEFATGGEIVPSASRMCDVLMCWETFLCLIRHGDCSKSLCHSGFDCSDFQWRSAELLPQYLFVLSWLEEQPEHCGSMGSKIM